jgi:hypothetical protein
MYRVTVAPKTDDFEKNPLNVNQWLKTVEGRLNLYSSAADPVASEVPIGQWVFHRNTTTNVTKIWANWNGTLTSFGAAGVTAVTATSPLASSGGGTPDISIPLTTGTGTTVVLNAAPTISDMYASGLFKFFQTAPTSKAAAATLTGAEQTNGILNYTGAAANITTCTAAQLNTAFSPPTTTNNMACFWSLINTGAGNATVVANTGVTIVGSAVVAAGTSGFFILRRTTSTAASFYRVA